LLKRPSTAAKALVTTRMLKACALQAPRKSLARAVTKWPGSAAAIFAASMLPTAVDRHQAVSA